MLSNILILIYVFANISANGDFSDNYRIIHRGVNPFDLEPEVTMTLAEMVAYYGYPLEVHHVITKDGYILVIHRIPHGKNIAGDPNKLPILLFHGIYLCSDVWVSNTPDKSLGFLLAEAGFDVWMINTRGNVYSQEHVNLDPSQDEFWNFSVDDLVYDTSAFIDHVIKKTGKSQVIILGFSLGGWMPLITLSTFPQYNEKVKAIYALSPVGNFKDTHFHLRALFKALPPILQLLKKFGIHTINLAPPWLPRNLTRMPVFISHINGGAQSNFLLYFLQAMDNPGLRHFDWGLKENVARYGQADPPDYDLRLVEVPVHFLYTINDYLASKANVQNLYDNVANPVSLSMAGHEWNHISYFYSRNAGQFLKELVAKIISGTKN